MTNLCFDVLKALSKKSLVTAESCTGGGIGSEITSVAGSSSVYKGGIISYCNEIKESVLGVPSDILEKQGAVSAQVAEFMAVGVRNVMNADVGVSVTGLAGPGGDDFGNPIGTVFIGYADENIRFAKEYHFDGNRESIRMRAIEAALKLVLENNQ